MDPYDIADAFDAIEDELIESIIRNMKRHHLEEISEKKEWAMWQTMQLEALERYKKINQKKYGKKFKDINSKIESLIREANEKGYMGQEIEILEAIKNGFKGYHAAADTMQAEFFKVNERKLEALIEATTKDMQKAETAILRMADDKYRQTIYNAQVYANTGAGTYEKAVDMAVKDFATSGLNCIAYANGARHTLKDYADMAIRTASKRAYLQGEGTKRQEWGISTVIMNKRGNPCPKCLPFCGKVLIDDVWSGGRSDGADPETKKKYPTMSYAISKGLYHPRCRDSHTTYFPGISTADDKWTKKELEAIGIQAKQEARQQYAERQAKKFGRLAKYSLDEDNQKMYSAKEKQWGNVQFKTGEEDSEKCLKENRKEEFLGTPKDITSEWNSLVKKQGSISDTTEYFFNGQSYKVDGKRVVLDYSIHEKEVGEILAKAYGKNVKMIPRVTYPQEISTPDFEIDGVGWDLKTISTAGKNVLYNAVKKKKRQARCFIFDISGCPLKMSEIEKQANDLFRTTHLTFIDKIGLYKNGEVIKVYERKK